MSRGSQLIVAPGYRGHRLMYVSLLAEEALRRGRRPHLVLLKGARTSEEYRTQLAGLESDVTISELEAMDPALLRPLVPDGTTYRTVISEADTLMLPLARQFPRWPGGTACLLLRGSGQSSSQLVQRAQSVAKRGARLAVSVLTSHQPYVLRSFAAKDLQPTEVRDPIRFDGRSDLADAFRSSWVAGESGVRSWVGVVGAIGRRKNIPIVSEAVARLNGRVGLVIAGPGEVPEEEIDEWTRPLRGIAPVHRIARQLDDLEFDSLFLALDCIAVVHSNEGPSGVFAKAWAAGTRVVAAGARSLRADALEVSEVAEWHPMESSAIADAIDRCIQRGRVAPQGVYSIATTDFSGRLVG